MFTELVLKKAMKRMLGSVVIHRDSIVQIAVERRHF